MLTLTPSLSIKDVHNNINKYKTKLSLFKTAVFFEKGIFKGILTLGDLRRLLAKENINKSVRPFLNKKPIYITENELNQNLNNIVNKRIETSSVNKIDYILVFNNNRTKVIKFLKLSELDNVKYKSISVIGAGHIGLPLSIHFNKKNFNVNLHDQSFKQLSLIKNNRVQIYEKNLNYLLKNFLSQKKLLLRDMNNLNSQIYILCVGSGLKKNRIDNNNIINLTKKISKILKKNDLLIFRGTTSYGLITSKLIPILKKNKSLTIGKDLFVSYCPERIVEGDALHELETIPQIVSGYTNNCLLKSYSFWSNFNDNLIKASSIEQAELIKLISNSYRDLQFAFANSVVKLASKFKISAVDTIEKSNFGYKRNLIAKPSVGVGGSCLIKDPILLSNSFNSAYPFGKISRKINQDSIINMSNFIKKYIYKNNLNKKILIVGVAFKGYPETIDLRHSPSIDLYHNLKKFSFSPKFLDLKQDLIIKHNILSKQYFLSKNKLFDFNSIIVMNNNSKYLDLINKTLFNSSKKYVNKLFIDPWCLFDRDFIVSKGFNYNTL